MHAMMSWCGVITNKRGHCGVVAGLKEAWRSSCLKARWFHKSDGKRQISEVSFDPGRVQVQGVAETDPRLFGHPLWFSSLKWFEGALHQVNTLKSVYTSRGELLSLWTQLYNVTLMMSPGLSLLGLGHHQQKACVTKRGCGVTKMLVFTRLVGAKIRCCWCEMKDPVFPELDRYWGLRL